DIPVVVEVLVVIRLAVAIEVMEARDLVAAEHKDGAIHEDDAERLEQPGGDAAPCHRLQVALDPGKHPDITVPGRDDRVPAVGKYVERPESHPRTPWVLRRGDLVDGQSPLLPGRSRARRECLIPARRASPRQPSQRFRGRVAPGA